MASLNYQVVYDDDAGGTSDVIEVEFPSMLRNVNWQFNPGDNTTWDATVQGRLSADHDWVDLYTIDDDVDATDLLFETPAFPQMRVEVGTISGGSDAVTMAVAYTPVPRNFLGNASPKGEMQYELAAPALLLQRTADGDGDAVAVPSGDLLDHVAVQITPGADVTAWTVTFQGRLHDDEGWVDLDEVAHDDTDGPDSGPRLGLTLGVYPQLRAVLSDYAGSGTDLDVSVSIHFDSISDEGFVSITNPVSEESHLKP